jgi:hypothetical protein
MTKPLYVHDCDCCTFLASFGGVDHYACHGSAAAGTVVEWRAGGVELVRRESSDGPDYTSLPAMMVAIAAEESVARAKYGITLELARAAGIVS